MRTEASVAVLRETLKQRGHILAKHPVDLVKRILSQGEYLVSLLSHDAYLMQVCDVDTGWGKYISNYGTLMHSVEGFLVFHEKRLEDAFDSYVDFIKFSWLIDGVQPTLRILEGSGFADWLLLDSSDRIALSEGLVLTAERRLRHAGVTFRQMAEFFADPKISGKLH